MDMSGPALIAGLVLSSIGLGLFLYGKKQRRAPQLGGGVLLMLLPILPCAVWLECALGALVLVGVQLAVRAGW